MILIKFVVLCFIVFLCASPSSELVVFDPGKWLYRTRSEGLTGYSCLSVLLPLRVRLGHLSWNSSGGSATNTPLTQHNGCHQNTSPKWLCIIKDEDKKEKFGSISLESCITRKPHCLNMMQEKGNPQCINICKRKVIIQDKINSANQKYDHHND